MNISQLFGSGSIPLGGSVLLLDALNPTVHQGAEYLRTGTIKTYDASYAASIVAAPQLRVFGNDEKTYGVTVGTLTIRYAYVSGRYIAFDGTGTPRQGAALDTLSVLMTNGSGYIPNQVRPAINGTAAAVIPSSVANQAPLYTINGTSLQVCGGSFATCPLKIAVCFGNNSWLMLSSLAAIAGERAYVNNVSPVGPWTIGASTNLGMGYVNAIAFGAGVFVAVGASGQATSGKFASTAAVGSAWTDRTPVSGMAASDNVIDVVFDGTEFVALATNGQINYAMTSPDGISWTKRSAVVDASSLHPQTGASGWAGSLAVSAGTGLTTDGAGTVILTPVWSDGTRPLFYITTDHGISWKPAQAYLGKVAAKAAAAPTMSHANGRWIENHSSHYQSCLDLGTAIADPDYIGQQTQFAAGQFVRIK